MKNIDLTFIVINWNNGDLLESCIPTLLNQKNLSIEVILIDNNSSDNSQSVIEKLPKDLRIVYNQTNCGYSGAANQGIKMSKGKYVSIINPDIILSDTYAFNIVEKFKQNSKLAAATGKLLKYDFYKNEPIEVIDTTGINVNCKFEMYDRGQNKTQIDLYDKEINVFGVSGAAPVYLKEALEDIRLDEEYFDEDFLAYKEDIDLSWRLRLYGWEINYVPSALGFHGRAVGSAKVKNSLSELIKHRKSQSKFVRKLSLRNHYLVLAKNMSKQDLHKSFFPLIKQETKRIVFCSLFEFSTLLGIFEAMKLFPKIKKKRKSIIMATQHRKSTVFFNES
ncbi:glycosyltransferase family 2 protein [Priestia megaterium]|nr:glycosyltransferase family 2 protein [Priestia megaterium]